MSSRNRRTRRTLLIATICASTLAAMLLSARALVTTHARDGAVSSGRFNPDTPRKFTLASPPTNILLSNDTVPDNSPSGATVGTLSTTDSDSTVFKYSLIALTTQESIDNGYFELTNRVLKTTAIFDFETKSAYNIRVRSTDESGLFFEKQFTINVIDGPDNLISFSSPTYNVSETDGNAVITLTRTGTPNNKIVAKFTLTDVTTSPADYRFTPGALDASFNPTCPGAVKALAVQADGKVIAASPASNVIARFNTDGSADNSFNPDPGAAIGTGWVGVQPDGKILVNSYVISGGSRRPARLNTNGSLDTSFDPGTGPDGSIAGVALQPDGKIIIAGNFAKYDGISRTRIARLNSDGSLDASFDPGPGADAPVLALAVRPDGKIIIVGSFSQYDGVGRARVARLNPDGTLDNSFFSFGNAPSQASCMALQPDGKIIIGGIGALARLNPDGSLDPSFIRIVPKVFDAGIASDGIVYQVVLQPDGKILIGGIFQTPGDTLTRFNPNGSQDTSFKPPSGTYDIEPPSHPALGALALQPDGKIIVAGFHGLISAGLDCLARLDGDVFINWATGDAADKTVSLPIVDDGIPEPNETMTLAAVPISGGAITGANPNATLTIINAHDKPTVNISAVTGNGIYKGTASLTASMTSGGSPLAGKTVTFRFYFTERSATTDANGVATLTNVPLTGYDSATCSCPAEVAAGTYDVVASFAGDANYLAGSNTGLATINKAATATTVSSSMNPSVPGEAVTFTATVSSAAGTPTGTVQFKVDGSNAGAPLDLNSSGLAVFSTNSLPVGTHSITADYSGSTNLVSSMGGLSGGQQVVDQAVISFARDNYDVSEGSGFVTIVVNRAGILSSAVTVNYATDDSWAPDNYSTVGGFASARCDFGAAAGVLKFAPGESQKAFRVLINRDSYIEGPESFGINLSNPNGGATFGTPSTTTVTIADDPAGMPGNTLDDPELFVRTTYHDFLNREPDSSGLDFWTKELTQCGSDAQCVGVKRINVSAAFILSIEFQETGYLVERLYRTAYGNAWGASTLGGLHQLEVPIVRLDEFIPDTQSIGQGVIVNQANWQQQLENNKQAFIAEFVQRSRFTTAFPATITAEQFVDTLNSNAGNPLSQSERDQLIRDLSTNTRTRAQVLRAVAEDADLISAEFNRAFVLMQYFGYLRRNPNDFQDSDYTGFDFWLTKLNLFQGNYVNAEMVKAFINSGEYRHRFGQ